MLRLSFLLAASLAACIGSTGIAYAKCDHFTPFGAPVHRSPENAIGVGDPPTWTVICHAGQVVAFNPEHNVSDWVAYPLRREDLLDPKVERKDAFRLDPLVPEGHRVVPDDYLNTGYDRGHLAPAGAMRWSEEAMSESFFMSNMAPQVGAGFNRSSWKALERRMRHWAYERGVLYVVTGPLYEARPIDKLVVDEDRDEVDDNGIEVDIPSHFFKLALDPGSMEAIAFILPNAKVKTKDLTMHLTSIRDVEARSRLDFLERIWDGAEQAIERHVQPGLWDKASDARCRDLN